MKTANLEAPTRLSCFLLGERLFVANLWSWRVSAAHHDFQTRVNHVRNERVLGATKMAGIHRFASLFLREMPSEDL
jgi:hypothetical protein